MGQRKGWATERTGRAPMRSPGRPGVNQRETKQAFWKCIAGGASSEQAAQACGMSQPLGPRWFRQAGGMSRISSKPPSDRYLSFTEREEIALLQIQKFGVREIARRLRRSPSTISRESRRNAATRGGKLHYRATVAQWKAERAARRPKLAKLCDEHDGHLIAKAARLGDRALKHARKQVARLSSRLKRHIVSVERPVHGALDRALGRLGDPCGRQLWPSIARSVSPSTFTCWPTLGTVDWRTVRIEPSAMRMRTS